MVEDQVNEDEGDGMSDWINALDENVNGVALSKLGKRNAKRLKDSGQFPDDPKPKNCADCGLPMDWRTTGQMTRAKKNGPFFYHKNHNESCQKDAVSIPIKEKVLAGKRCHNPRCSKVPILSWLKNKKSYCSVECCEGYQEWHDEVSRILHYPNPHRPPEMVSVIVDILLKELTLTM